jgi:hypothetical protein
VHDLKETLFLCGASFLNHAQNSCCTVITDLDKVQSACALNTPYNPVPKPCPHSKKARTNRLSYGMARLSL